MQSVRVDSSLAAASAALSTLPQELLERIVSHVSDSGARERTSNAPRGRSTLAQVRLVNEGFRAAVDVAQPTYLRRASQNAVRQFFRTSKQKTTLSVTTLLGQTKALELHFSDAKQTISADQQAKLQHVLSLSVRLDEFFMTTHHRRARTFSLAATPVGFAERLRLLSLEGRVAANPLDVGEILVRCTGLKELHLSFWGAKSGQKPQKDFAAALARLPEPQQLTLLRLQESWSDDALGVLNFLCACPTLQDLSLDCQETDVEKDIPAVLPILHRLRSLSLEGYWALQPTLLRHFLSHGVNVTELSLVAPKPYHFFCPNPLEALCGMRKLRGLSFSCAGLQSHTELQQALEPLPQLRSLEVRRLSVHGEAVDAVRPVGHLFDHLWPSLEELTLSDWHLSGDYLKEMGAHHFPSLRRLSFEDSYLDNIWFSDCPHLGAFPQLQELNLRYASVQTSFLANCGLSGSIADQRVRLFV